MQLGREQPDAYWGEAAQAAMQLLNEHDSGALPALGEPDDDADPPVVERQAEQSRDERGQFAPQPAEPATGSYRDAGSELGATIQARGAAVARPPVDESHRAGEFEAYMAAKHGSNQE
jgi:hypothetical protein